MSADFNELWKKARTATDEAESIRAVKKLLSSEDGRTFALNLEPSDAGLCIEILDHGLAENKLHAPEKQAFFYTLIELAGKHERLPESMVITDTTGFSTTYHPHTSGGLADITPEWYKGCTVAVKALRISRSDDFVEIRKRFCNEVILWNSLSHPNVLKLIGVLGGIDQYQFATVSEWMAHGNIMEYIRKYATNRLELLHGAVQGLKYLHDANLIYGGVSGTNILMTNDTPPRACLAGFGCITMVLEPQNAMSSSLARRGGTIMFMAPEMIAPSKFGLKDSVPTQEGDIYAFGLTVLQVLTGEHPFRNIKPLELAYHISSGVRPGKPENAEAIGISNSLWNLIQRCWDGNKTQRPQIGEVVAGVCNAAANWHAVMPPSVVDHSDDSVEEEESDKLNHISMFDPYESEESEESSVDRRGGEIYSGVDQHFDPPPLRLPQKERTGFKYLNSLLPGWSPGPIFKPSGKTRTLGGVLLSSSELVPLPCPPPLSLAEIAAESRRRPDQDLIDRVDGMLDNTVCGRDRHKLLNILCKMCSRQQMIPKSMHMANCLDEELTEEYDGGHANIFKGEHKGRAVAIKVLRLYLTSDFDKHFRMFFREAVAWRHLRHPNILPLLGVNLDLERYKLAMISEWMVHGNINEYVEKCGEVNRVQLLVDAANGLEYMHRLHMVHGDLKGANILINKSSRACLADFGLSTIVGVGHRAGIRPFFIPAASKVSLMSFTDGGTTRWMSPELLDPDQFKITDCRPTKQSDCYAFGMVVYEVLCGNAPYWEITNEPVVIKTIMDGGRPQKPEAAESLGFTNELWGIVEQCWSADASTRPDVETVLSHLNHATWSWERRQLV